MFGAPAVHGVHTLLWCLDAWSERLPGPFALTALKATFARPLRVDQPVEMTVRKDEGGKVRLLAASAGETVARVDFEWIGREGVPLVVKAMAFPAASATEHRTYDTLRGELPLAVDTARLARLTPSLAGRMAIDQLAAILATTRLVGMECPGLHSVFSELDIAFVQPSSASVAWRVAQADTRFGLVVMQLESPGLRGEVRAFIRPAPRRQLSFELARALVPP